MDQHAYVICGRHYNQQKQTQKTYRQTDKKQQTKSTKMTFFSQMHSKKGKKRKSERCDEKSSREEAKFKLIAYCRKAIL